MEMHKRTSNKYISYGTSGFRDNAEKLPYVCYRMGTIACLRCLYSVPPKQTATQKSQVPVVAVMFTASHNPVEDNGLKVIEADGNYLGKGWAMYAEYVVNLPDAEFEALEEHYCKNDEKIYVLVGRDTRPSCGNLFKYFQAAVEKFGFSPIDLGQVTTPQLHYVVEEFTERGLKDNSVFEQTPEAEWYLENIRSYTKDMRFEDVVVDCANGVGATTLKKLDCGLELINVGDGELNKGCGADHIKLTGESPSNGRRIETSRKSEDGAARKEVLYASLDGDADRVVFYNYLSDRRITLMDGDSIACLFGLFIVNSMKKMPSSNLRIGAVQTAYSDGNSTRFLEKLGIDVTFACTGVKHLQDKARKYDVGIYFEANGHGTILFSQHALDCFEQVEDAELSTVLKQLSGLMAQTTGDAIGDLFSVIFVLRYMRMTVDDWHRLYDRLPNRQLKIKVTDRSAFVCTNADRELERPAELQAYVNEIAEQSQKARIFVRPSGTEEIVRVFCEAETQETADSLCLTVADHVHRKYGGVGPFPSIVYKGS